MRNTKTSYDDLLDKAILVNKELQSMGIWPANKEGRFQYYIKNVSNLNLARKANKLTAFFTKNKGDETLFALKQLYELTSILGSVLTFLEKNPKMDNKEIIGRIKVSLSGPFFPKNENDKNNGPRNSQFELLVFSRMLLSGMNEINMLKNPDILTKISTRKYAIECKRVIGQRENALFDAIKKAIEQIETNWTDDLFSGVVAIDLSTKYEQGNNMLDSKSHLSANDFVQNQLEQDFNFIYRNAQKLVNSAVQGKIVGILLNISCIYAIRGIQEMGWMNEIALGVFDKENKTKADLFVKDFTCLSLSHIGL